MNWYMTGCSLSPCTGDMVRVPARSAAAESHRETTGGAVDMLKKKREGGLEGEGRVLCVNEYRTMIANATA